MVATLVPHYLTIPLHYFLVCIFMFEFQFFTGCRNQIKKKRVWPTKWKFEVCWTKPLWVDQITRFRIWQNNWYLVGYVSLMIQYNAVYCFRTSQNRYSDLSIFQVACFMISGHHHVKSWGRQIPYWHQAWSECTGRTRIIITNWHPPVTWWNGSALLFHLRYLPSW